MLYLTIWKAHTRAIIALLFIGSLWPQRRNLLKILDKNCSISDFFPRIFSILLKKYHQITFCQTIPDFYVSAEQVFWKKLWEKEKLLERSNFSFSHSVFIPHRRTFCHFHRIWSCCLQSLSVWKNLKFVILERVMLHLFPYLLRLLI